MSPALHAPPAQGAQYRRTGSTDPRATTPIPTLTPMFAQSRMDLPCAQPGVDPELWFQSPGTVATAYAKHLCGGCPARAQCLAWALDNKPGPGVWGGLDEIERKGASRA